MAEQDTKPDVSISKGLRRLKGDWLEEAGFKTDTPVEVRVLPGCLILTAQEPQPTTEPEVLTQLRRPVKNSPPASSDRLRSLYR